MRSCIPDFDMAMPQCQLFGSGAAALRVDFPNAAASGGRVASVVTMTMATIAENVSSPSSG